MDRYADSPIRFLIQDDEPIDRVVWTNAESDDFRFVPRRMTVSVQLGPWRGPRVDLDGLLIELPRGWLCEPATWLPLRPDDNERSWVVYPRGEPDGYRASVRVYGMKGDEAIVSVSRTLTVEERGYGRFNPALHALPMVNRASRFGRLRPSREVFARTYWLALFPRALFEGIYGSVVYVGDEPGRYQGGLCAGMARAALERSLAGDQTLRPSIEDVMVWHGRQLSDSVVLASAPWFLLPSPGRAYRRFRDDLLRRGWSDVCFDLGVPRLGRRRLSELLDRTGHTVVPVAYRQASDERAEVLVYDPNDEPVGEETAPLIQFDLTRDTYAYRHRARLEDDATTIMAVRQPAYRLGETAILAGLVNASWRLWRRAPAAARPAGALLALSGLLVAFALLLARARRR